MKRLALASLFAALLLTSAAARAADDPAAGWKVIVPKWEGGNSAHIWKLAAWPGKDQVLASTARNGLWSSTDGGENFKRTGEPGKSSPGRAGLAVQFVFDPKDPNTMWTSGMYGYGVWKSADGAKSFTQVGKETHVNGFAVDFSDPARKVQLFGLHEQEHSLHKSTDGGQTWAKIGDKIPQGSKFSTDPIILDTKTYLIDSCGWDKKDGNKWGIYRTVDGGDSWTKVSEEGASGNATVTSKGDIFWSTQWGGDLIKSADQGKTWTKVKGMVRGLIEEVAPGRLVGLGGPKKAQLYVSKDDGRTWKSFGDPLPFTARNFTYDAARKSFFACEEIDDKKPKKDVEVARWDLKGDLEAAFEPQ